MRRRALTLALYVTGVALLTTSLFDAVWPSATLLVAAHLGLGIGIARPWALLPPVVLALVVFLLSGASGLAWLTLIVGLPALLGLTALGWALGRGPDRLAAAASATCAAAAAFACVWVGIERLEREAPLPASVQAQLPLEVSLGNLCPDAESPPDLQRDVELRAKVLLRELRNRPNHVVTQVVHDAHSGDAYRRQITVRQLAEDQLEDLESPAAPCAPRLERRLREAL